MKECTILLKDEVNCKILGLDLDTRRKLVKQFSYDIPYARHTPAYKLGRWDGKISFFQLGGTTFINLLDEILPTLIEEYNVSIDDRRSNQTFDFKKIDENSFSHIKWPTGHTLEGQPIKLREHQVQAIDNFLSNPQSLQEIATGSGKCITFDSILDVDIKSNFKDFLSKSTYEKQ